MALSIELTERDARRLLAVLIAVELFLAAMGVVNIVVGDRVATVRVLFDMDEESSIPAWFSSMQLFSIGALLLITSRQPAPSSSPSRLSLRLAGLSFVFLSMDEAAIFHERISWVLGNNFLWLPRFETGYGIWMYIYLPVALGVLLWLRRDLVAVWRDARRELLIILAGAAITLLGAMGLESFGYIFLRQDMQSVGYRAEVILEEFLEMLGMSVVLYGTLLFALHQLSRGTGPPRPAPAGTR